MIRGSDSSIRRWNRPAVVRWIHELGAEPLFRVVLCAFLVRGNLFGGDILRGGASGSSTASPTAAASSNATPTPVTKMVTSAQDRLARTTQALAAVRAMQTAARNLAISGPNNLRSDLPAVPINSFGQANGLVVAPGVPKDLLNPATGEDPTLWTGANLPVSTTQTANGATTSTVTIQQTQQQAILNWQSFNIGKSTTLAFDQGAGGADVGQWIAFNYVRDPSGRPSQILGAMKTIGAPDAQGNAQVGGQVYVMNSNGIIFGGSSQVNAHALVASSLPINYNLIQSGLLDNPDAQFLFSALPQTAGGKGPTPGFDPAVASPDGLAPVQTPYAADGSGNVGNYGDVIVQPGAQLTAPTNANHVGGRVALIGPNVTNAGTISTEDGQTILAAGLQVGFGPHISSDPTLRGLDAYVGEVTDVALPNQPLAGVATNAGLDATNLGVATAGFNTTTTNATKLNPLGLIDAPRGDVYITGKTVNQSGGIDSTTSVAYNGRVDLLANYNAVPNPSFGDTSLGSNLQYLPFLFPSNVANNLTTGAPVASTGQVILGADSVLQIMPETESADRVAGYLALPSQVQIEGQSVHFASNAILMAPGAAVPDNPALGIDGKALDAGVTIRAGGWIYGGGSNYSFVFSNPAQQISFDQGALVSVAGLADVTAPVTENIVSVELRGSELANSPLQRDGALRGQTIQVDVRDHGAWDSTLNNNTGGYAWVGTPLADTSGWIALATHTAGELTINGGSVALKAGGGVALNRNSTIDVSGGSIDYQGGVIQTTKVLAQGHVYDIAQATPDRVYDGIYTGATTTTDPKWGTTQTTVNPLSLGAYENGYTQGGNGGAIAITAPTMTLGGTLLGSTVVGPLQRTLIPKFAGAATDNPLRLLMFQGQYLPTLSSLSLTFQSQIPDPRTPTQYVSYSPTPPTIVFGPGRSSDASILYVSPDLVDSSSAAFGGFGRLTIDNSDDSFGKNSADVGIITVPAGVSVTTLPGGSITFHSANLDIEGKLAAPGGALSFIASDISTSTALEAAQIFSAPPFDANRGQFTLGAGAVLSAAGLIVDDRTESPTAGSGPLLTAGGSVTIAGNAVGLTSGGMIDVSGGAVVGANGKVTYGKGGAIALRAGQDTSIPSVTGGRLALGKSFLSGGSFRGFSGGVGGSLGILAPLIQIGGSTLLNGGKGIDTLWLNQTDSSGKLLQPDFFSQGGFASFSLTGLGQVDPAQSGQYLPAILIAPGTSLAPVAQSWVAATGRAGGGAFTLTPTSLAVGVRTPISLSFSAAGVKDSFTSLPVVFGSFVMGAGASIATDPQTDPAGGVKIGADTVELFGSIVVPGGSISVSGAKDTALMFPAGRIEALPTVDLGPNSLLSTAGATVLTPDPRGYRTGTVLDGGMIKISGNIVAEGASFDTTGKMTAPGAVLDVSGTSDNLDVPVAVAGTDSASTGSTTGSAFTRTRVDSNGGSIALSGGQELFTNATLLGRAGGPNATGGRLSVSSGIFYPGDNPAPTDASLFVTQSGPTFAAPAPGGKVIGNPVVDAKGKILSLTDAVSGGKIFSGRFAVDGFTQGGFDSLTLVGTVEFSGRVSIAASGSLTIGSGGVILADPSVATKVTLSAPYVALGAPFPLPQLTPSSPLAGIVLPSYGSGALSVQAGSLIDIGSLSLQNIGTAMLNAGSGDIRGDGVLDVAGNVSLSAGQVYVPTAANFTIAAYDYTASDGTGKTGSVTILPSGNTVASPLPLSAGGQLNVYGSTIVQGGTLRAPLGKINLGSDGTVPDLLSGASFAKTQQLTLQPGSETSVSAVDPTTGLALTIPYGINQNGTVWVDPLGTDITIAGNGVAGQGLPAKTVNITGANVNVLGTSGTQPAAQIDLTGGGDLYAYQWVTGVGGTNDFLLSSSSFSVNPGYQAAYAPFAPFGTSDTNLLAGDPGYVNGNLKVGDHIYLQPTAGLPAGFYTLLPARYALLPGGFLVTQRSTGAIPPAQAVAQPDGSTIVAGYRTNAFSPSQPLFTSFEVARGTALDPTAKDTPPSVVRSRAQYDDFYASSFFSQNALANNIVVPRLPLDAGQLALATTGPMSLLGAVAAQPADGGRGGQVDISSSLDILIASPTVIAGLNAGGLNPANQTEVVLDSTELSSFGAESLLIGGIRQPGVNGTAVSVTTNSLTVNNAGAPLTSPEVILVSNVNLTLSPGSDVEQSGQHSSQADTLQFGSSSAASGGQILQLSSAGASSVTVAGGTTIALPAGTPGNDKITLIGSGTFTSGGMTISFTGSTKAPFSTTLSAGGTVAFANSGTIAFASGTGGAIPVSLPTLANVSTTGTTNPATLALQLGASGSSSLANLAAGTKVAFPLGTPGSDQITLTGSGTITSGSGATAPFSGDAKTPVTTTLATGSTVVFNGSDASNPGTVTFAGGTGGAIPITLAGQNTFSAVNVTNVTPAGSGSGALVRVTSDPSAQIARTSLMTSSTPVLAVGSNARVLGASVMLDSTAATTLDSSAILGGPGSSVSLDSGQISLQLAGAGPLRTQANGQTTSGLVLSGSALKAIQNSATALSLLSYSSIDIYGNGTIGSPTFASIALHAPEIYGDGGTVGFAAKNILVDNSSNSAPPDAIATTSGAKLTGTLTFSADTIQLGSNQLNINNYAAVDFIAANQVTLQGSGGLAAQGSLTMATPAVVAVAPSPAGGATASTQTINAMISAAGDLLVAAPAGGPAPSAASDLGASLTLVGRSVDVATEISLPSGSLELHANGTDAKSDVTLESAATLDVGGTAKTFNDLTKFTDGGHISLLTDYGSVNVAKDATVNVSAQKSGGSAGSLSISAPNGILALADGSKLLGQGGEDGLGGPDGSQGGRFSLDVSSIPGLVAGTNSLASLGKMLFAGGFNGAFSLRARTGNVAVDGTLTAHEIDLSADQGSITVTGKGVIDASGKTTDSGGKLVDTAANLTDGTWKIDATGTIVDGSGNIVTLTGGTGGSVSLAATGSVVLASGADLSVAGIKFDDAGKGGAVLLTAGASTLRTDGTYGSDSSAVVDIQKGALIDLSLASVNQSGDPNATANAAAKGEFTGTLHLRAPQNAAGTDLQIQPIGGTIKNASSIVAEGYRVYSPVGGVIDTVTAAVKNDGAAFAGGIDSAGNLQPGHTGDLVTGTGITGRVLTGNADAAALAAVFHLEPGAEIVNTADPTAATTFRLNNAASSLVLPSNTTVAFPSGGAQLAFSVAGTISGASGKITSPDGKTTTAFTAASNPTFVAGSTITLDGAGTVTLTSAGKLTLASGASAVTVALPPGATYTAGGTSGVDFLADTGARAILSTPGSSGSAIALAAGVKVAFPNGTPGTDRLKSTQAGTVIWPDGTSKGFSANSATITVPVGGIMVLDQAGTITYASGSSVVPLSIALSKGTYTTNGAVDLTTSAGNLTLASTWDLSTYRFGPKVDPTVIGSGEPGVLTLRAAGNLSFDYTSYNSTSKVLTAGTLSDGFGPAASAANGGLWAAPMLPAGSQSWSYRLVAGADPSAADSLGVQSLADLGASTGSFLLGSGSPPIQYLNVTTGRRQDTISQLYQTVRTGTGDIEIAAGRDVQLLNPLATVYTAGSQVQTPTMLYTKGDFDVPVLGYRIVGTPLAGQLGTNQQPNYGAQFSDGGGNVTISAQDDIAHYTVNSLGQLVQDSSKEMPNNWLYRRGYLGADGQFAATRTNSGQLSAGQAGDIASTAWWIDFSNFFEGVGALGGGNITLTAGRDVSNVDAAVPTNARMPKGIPDASKLVELGGGNLSVVAGRDINGGVYYVERGLGSLTAGGEIRTNATRATLTENAFAGQTVDSTYWLPTALFLGKGSFDIIAGSDVLLGPMANPFLLPQGINNTYFDKTYFSTYAADDAVRITSLAGDVEIKTSNSSASAGSLEMWFDSNYVHVGNTTTAAGLQQPWLRTVENSSDFSAFSTVFNLMPATIQAASLSGNIDLAGRLTLSPAPNGTFDLLAAKSINGLQIEGLANQSPVWSSTSPYQWATAAVDLSDADPRRVPGVASPFGFFTPLGTNPVSPSGLLAGINALFAESGATSGQNVLSQTQTALHGRDPDIPASEPAQPLHATDPGPVHLYAGSGDISGLTLFAGKTTQVVAGRDITDVAFYVQNVRPDDLTIVAAGRDLIAYDPISSSRLAAQATGNELLYPSVGQVGVASGYPNAGNIQISGPGTLEVLAGRNLDLGAAGPKGSSGNDAPPLGITSVGNARNPLLPYAGADIVAAAGIGPSISLAASGLDYAAFIAQFLNPATAGANATRYLPDLGQLLGFDSTKSENDQIWTEFASLPEQTPGEKEAKDRLVLDVFYAVLRDAGRDHNNPDSAGFHNYNAGLDAIRALFPGSRVTPDQTSVTGPWDGSVTLATHEIATAQGGNVMLLVPGGGVTVGRSTDPDKVDQGILTARGGNISVFSQGDIEVGRSRVFTLRGGAEILWSSLGNIAAGSGSKTVFAAPPTRVLIDPQSADTQNDLTGLATGAGIGVLATIKGVPPGDVDLVAPVGTIDAGDAGIRATGNLNIAARVVLNSSNIQVGGSSAGTPPPPAPPNLAPLTAASNASAVTSSAASDIAKQETTSTQAQVTEVPSIITVEVLGYGGEDEAEQGIDESKGTDSDRRRIKGTE